MLRTLLLVALVAVAFAGQASAMFNVGTTPNQFMVTYSGLPSFEKLGFYTMPRTWEEAGVRGFFKVKDRVYEDHTEVWCRMNDYRVCVLFDRAGSVAGIQLSVDISELKDSPVEIANVPEWHREELLNHNVYAARVYFVTEEVLKSGGRNDMWTPEGLTIPDGIYIAQWNEDGVETGRLHVSPDMADAEQAGFNEQSCFIGMGKHFFQGLTKESTCEKARPYFLLFNKKTEKLQGFGFTMYGEPSKDYRKWFESPPAPVAKMIAPNSPSCMPEWINKYGMFTLHVYFVEKPWFSGC